jgi:predicted permease
VALQMSLCLVLLVGAGLLARSLRNLATTNLGLHASGLLAFGISPPAALHNDPEVLQFFQTLTDRLRALPGVESATLMQNRIGSGWSSDEFCYVDGVLPLGERDEGLVRWNAVGARYFQTLRIPLLLGRDLSDGDAADAPKVVVINQTFAQRLVAGRNPIGHRVAFHGAEGNTGPYTIVGVAADSKYRAVDENPRPMAYFPYTQIPGVATMHFELRTEGNPADMIPQVQRAVREFGPDLVLLEPMTQEEQFARSYSEQRLVSRLAAFFGLMAALLVATGLYGTLAYKVSRRTPEIGVRMALGAERKAVLWMVLRESLALCLVGVLVGLPPALWGARLLRSMIYGLGVADPLTFIAAPLGIALLALGASYLPARRATRVDPIVALRCE